jgi:glycosyltransferase involved in cell wall biosynthesis
LDIPVILNVAVCLPARDEKENLDLLLDELSEALRSPIIGKALVVVFDDASRADLGAQLSTRYFDSFELVVIRSSVSIGKSAALHHAFSEALRDDMDAIVMMDADWQDDPQYIPAMLQELINGNDVVNGRRANRQHSWSKRVSSKAFNATVRRVTKVPMADINSGYKAMSRSGALALMPYLYGELHRVILVVAVWIGLHVGEVRVVNRPRRFGKTKYGFARAWRGILDMWTVQFLRRYHARPGHFFSGAGVGLISVSVVVLLAGFVGPTLGFGAAANGALTDVALRAIFYGAILVSIGFLAELILFLSKGAPTVAIRSHQPTNIPARRGSNDLGRFDR